MSIWKKPRLSLVIVSVLIIALLVGCTAQQRPNNDDGPTPTRAPRTNDLGVNDVPGVNDMGPNDNRNNMGNRNTGVNDGVNDANSARNNLGNNPGNNLGDNNNRNNAGVPKNGGGGSEGNMRLADDVADRLTNMREIDAATVLLTDNNAYVAVDLPGDQRGRVTNDLKDRISDEVRHVDRSIENVYVSGDPDFFNRMGGYARDIRNGQPIEGLFDEVTETIRRVFPTAH